MKKLAIFLVIVLALSAVGYAVWNFVPGVQDLFGKQPCTEHVDADGDYICDNCQERLQHDDPQPVPDHECADNNGDHECDMCGTTLSECTAAAGSHNCAICNAPLSECADADTDHKCDVCEANVGEHVAAEGSHSCAYCGLVASDCADADGDFACDVCGAEVIPDTHEKVEYYLNISDLDTGVRSADDINSKFTIASGTEVRNRTKTYNGVEYNKSVKIGGNAHKIVVSVPGTGTLRFIIQNGSSGVDMQFTKVIAPDGTVKDIEFVAGAESNPLVMIEVEVTEGEWTITRTSSSFLSPA